LNPTALHQRFLLVIRGLIWEVLRRLRHAVGVLLQSAQRDEIQALREETHMLGSASVESVAHVGAELREINERVQKLERDIERLLPLVDDQGSEAPSPESESKSSASSLSAD
jgi:hypothetical protein